MLDKNTSIEALRETIKELKDRKEEIEQTCEQSFDARDELKAILKDLDDFFIPTNIKHRADEIGNLKDKIDAVLEEFKELKKADEDFEGDSTKETEIKEMISKIEEKVNKI